MRLYYADKEHTVIALEDGPEVWNFPADSDHYKLKEALASGAGIEPYAAPPSVRRAEILAELAAIDAASVRPLRAVLAGQGAEGDQARLAALEERAAALREELAA